MTQNQYEVGTLEDARKFEIIRMAREAGIAHAAGIYMEHIERFAALVAAHASADEREACAKVCEEVSIDNYGHCDGTIPSSCAEYIRARGLK